MKRLPIWFLFVGVAFCWGMNTVAMTVAGKYAPSLSVAALRALCGAIILLTMAKRSGASFPTARADWVAMAAIGVSMTGLSTAFFFLGARAVPAGVLAILSNSMPLFTAILAPIVLGERLTGRIGIGLLVGMLGTVLIAWRAIAGDISVRGVIYGLLGAGFAAVGSVLYRKWPLRGFDRTMTVGVQLAVSFGFLGVWSIPDDRSAIRITWPLILSFVYLAIVVGLSFVMYSELLSRATALQSGSVAYTATVFGVVLGAVLLRERLSWLVLIGGAITIAGVALVQFTHTKKLALVVEPTA
jgi:drug/metabolite transporter (DMT)-like permease